MQTEGWNYHKLDNGIGLVHQRMPGQVAHCGIIVNTGSRDEQEQEQGLAHFIEHVIFKGTVRRKAYHVLSRLDDVGGELNAFTAKEETWYHASFLKEYFSRAIELLSDIVFHSTFPDKELAREKDVVLDEINSYKDSPADLIYDDFEDLVYKGHPLGRNILGTPRHIRRFDRAMIRRFMQANYHTDQMALSIIGDLPFGRAKRLAERYLGQIPANPRPGGRVAFTPNGPEERMLKKRVFQAHCVMGATAYDIYDGKRWALYLLNNLLGGPGMNTRLNMSLREKNGIAYNVESNYQPYTDTGMFNIYFGTDKKELERAKNLVYKELDLLCTRRLGTMQLSRAKKQMLGQMALSMESPANLMMNNGKSYLLFGRTEPFEHIVKRVEAISSTELLDTANEILKPDRLSTLIYMKS